MQVPYHKYKDIMYMDSWMRGLFCPSLEHTHTHTHTHKMQAREGNRGKDDCSVSETFVCARALHSVCVCSFSMEKICVFRVQRCKTEI